MPLLEALNPGSAVVGVRWHKPSGCYIAEVGYHNLNVIAPDGTVTTKRIRTTHYLGDAYTREGAEAKFDSIKRDWEGWAHEQRKVYDKENEERKERGLPPLPRFKPTWPKAKTRKIADKMPRRRRGRPNLIETSLSMPTPTAKQEVMMLTVHQARDRYVEDLKGRIGLQNGKGINKNTWIKSTQSLDLGLGLNKGYGRPTRPIQLNARLGDLTVENYEAFVRFWCNPENVKSPRSALNYIRAFRQMVKRLKVTLPEGFDDAFTLKVPKVRKIAKYDPAILKILLNCEHERARLFSLLCLNCGFYAIDIVRLRPEHITDAEGNPNPNGEYITKRREKTLHQNDFAATHWLWPETRALMAKHKARANPSGTYFLSKLGTPYDTKTPSGLIEQVIRDNNLNGQFSVKQFRKVGASQIKALSGSDAMHQYKSNALNAADAPYILEDYSILTSALQKLREKLIADGVLNQRPAVAVG